ncbi:UDP-glucuronate 4-epimerase 6 [Hibiscus syriacus]|uniref:UDP-glucuronate 4-epimerase 6 n=1 Tax=Hibiscus syriacus TaxID=106335 RepID=A0A6A2YJK7_HIBSY|nr:UDP-glucuronate 4-epimerase 6 [Hibiscus syriacus]
MPVPPDTSKTMKLERYKSYVRKLHSTKLLNASSKFLFRVTLLIALVLILFFTINYPPLSDNGHRVPPLHRHSFLSTSLFSGSSLVGGASWRNKSGTLPRRVGSMGSPFWSPAPPGSWGYTSLLSKHQIFIVEGDLNDAPLLTKLFDVVPFTHVLHLAAQAGVRYAMQNPQSPPLFGLRRARFMDSTENPFSERDRTDQPASLYAATKKAGEEIAHTYNHIYGLSLTGLRFFTVYGPWGRPDMAYFFFTKDILQGKPIDIYKTHDQKEVARDFTYIDDVVKGCLGALDTAEKSTGSGGKKKGPAQLRVYNLGNTSPVPVGRLVSILEGLLGTKAKKHVITMPRNGDVPFTHANVTLAYKDFGYKPTTDLAAGLRKFVKWYVNYFGIESKSTKGTQHADESS